MSRHEADRLDAGLRRAFAGILERVEGARLEERQGYRWISSPGMPLPGLNGIWADGPEEEIAVRELEGAIAEIERLGGPCWIEARAGRTPAIEAEAVRLGFRQHDSLPGMVGTATDLKGFAETSLEIVTVRDHVGLGVVADLLAAGFEAPLEMLAGLVSPQVAAMPGLSIYLARVDGQPVATATSWLGEGAVGIFNVATPPQFRGRGYGTAVTRRAVRDGFAAAADLAWLQASALGEPVYQRMGFRQVDSYLVMGRAASD